MRLLLVQRPFKGKGDRKMVPPGVTWVRIPVASPFFLPLLPFQSSSDINGPKYLRLDDLHYTSDLESPFH